MNDDPIPEQIKAIARHIAQQIALEEPELLEAFRDDPESFSFYPPDLCLLTIQFVKDHPDLSTNELAGAIMAEHGHAWIDSELTTEAILTSAVLQAMRRLIQEGEL